MTRGSSVSPAVVLAPVFIGLLAYGFNACRTVYFGDSAELAAAAATLGVAHPPGYPLYLLLGRLVAACVPGEPALGVNLLSGLAAAATAGAAAALALFLGARPLAAATAGLFVVGSRMIWSQAVVAEVYTLNAALATGVLLALAADEQRPRNDFRALLMAAYLLGLGLAHHLSIVYVGLAAFVLLAARRRAPWRAIVPAGVLAGTALSLYAVLVVRSRLDPPLDWGNPETLSRLIDHVTARPYHFLVGKLRGPDALERLGKIAAQLATDLHPAFIALAGLGFASLRRRPAWLFALVIFVIALVAHAVVYGIPDIGGHLLPAAVVLAIATALGLDVVARALERALSRPASRVSDARATAPRAAALVYLAAVVPILLNFGNADRSKHRSAHEFGENLLASLPPGATLLAEGDNQVFILAYFVAARGARPDVTVIDREGNLLSDFYGARGEHAPPPASDFNRLRLKVENEQLAKWFAVDPDRPVYSSGRTNLPDVGPFLQETSGLLMRIRPRGTPPSAPPSDPWAGIHTRAIENDARNGDPLTREVAARYWVRRGEAAFERSDRAAVTAAFDSALALAPQNADLCSYMGAFYAQNDMLDEAIPLLERAVEENPLSVRGWTNLGLALIKMGRRDEGKAALRESLRIQPDQEQIVAILRQLRGG